MMAPKSTQSNPLRTAVLDALQKHGTGRWPAGVAQAIAEQVGSTVNSVTTTKCRLAKGLDTASSQAPVVEVPPDPGVPVITTGGQGLATAEQLELGQPSRNGNGVHAAVLEPPEPPAEVSAPEPAEPIPADPERAERLALLTPEHRQQLR